MFEKYLIKEKYLIPRGASLPLKNLQLVEMYRVGTSEKQIFTAMWTKASASSFIKMKIFSGLRKVRLQDKIIYVGIY